MLREGPSPQRDCRRPPLSLALEVREGLLRRPGILYGEAAARRWMPELGRICRVHYAHKPREMIERERDFSPWNASPRRMRSSSPTET